MEESLKTIHPSSRDDQVDLKKKCLARDGFRCVLSGRYDGEELKKRHIHSTTQEETTMRMCLSECAHILPFALRKFDKDNKNEVSLIYRWAYLQPSSLMLIFFQMDNKARIWWVLRRYFPFIQGKITSDSINKPENAITICHTLHPYFGRFWLALEPLGEVRC